MSEDDKYCMTSFICGIYKNANYRHRVEWWLSGTGGEVGDVEKGYTLPVIR